MKTVIVTGSTGGMGRKLCVELAKAGANLAICANDAVQVAAQAQELEAMGATVVSAAFPIYEEKSVAAFFAQAAEQFGAPDVLVNLAGLSIPTQMDTVSAEDFDQMVQVNVKGMLLASKHYAKHAEEGGLIINIGSMAARKANGNAPLYCMTKSAVNMLSAGMQIQLAEKNIRITTLNPGGTDTPFWGTRAVDRSKLMQAEDVVDVILFVIEHPRMVFYSIDFESSARVPGIK